MVDAAREALTFAHGRTLNDLRNDRMLALSLVKELEIIGEAAGKVSEPAPGCPTDRHANAPAGLLLTAPATRAFPNSAPGILV
jgi:uncharacterized protein with HEPN domain